MTRAQQATDKSFVIEKYHADCLRDAFFQRVWRLRNERREYDRHKPYNTARKRRERGVRQVVTVRIVKEPFAFDELARGPNGTFAQYSVDDLIGKAKIFTFGRMERIRTGQRWGLTADRPRLGGFRSFRPSCAPYSEERAKTP